MTQKQRDEQPEFFVSRRGRHVGLHEVDLKGIDVDSDEPTTAKPSKRPAKKAVEKVPKRASSRRRRLVIATVIALLILVPLSAAELVAAQYRSAGASAREELDQLVKRDVLPLQKKATVTADQLRSVATKIDGIGSKMCRGGLLDNAAGLYPRATTALEQCKTSQRSFTALSATLFTLESQARYLERLGTIIEPVTTPITDEYAVIAAQQAAWQKAADGLKKLSPPTAMNAAHTELMTHVTAVADGWSALNTANNAQEAAAFTDAEKTLSTEYEAVRGSSEQLLSVLHDTQARLSDAYDALK